jgi:hypothetical protein
MSSTQVGLPPKGKVSEYCWPSKRENPHLSQRLLQMCHENYYVGLEEDLQMPQVVPRQNSDPVSEQREHEVQ